MNFKMIATYDDIGDLIESECPEYVNNVEPDVMDYLHHINDFEPLSFMVLNGDLVLVYDNISGYVVGQQDIAEFIDQSVDYAREELENENLLTIC